MASVTLLQLRDRAKDRANMENSTFVTDAMWNTYINYSISELRDIITSKVGEDYFAASASYTFISNQEEYALPATFYKCLWVEMKLDTNPTQARYKKMRRFEITEQDIDSFSGSPEIRYRIRANNLVISPSFSAGGKEARLWHTPVPTALSADADTLDGFNGWDEFIVITAAKKALTKEEQDVQELDRDLMIFEKRLNSMVPNRDQGQPMRVYDNQRGSNWP